MAIPRASCSPRAETRRAAPRVRAAPPAIIRSVVTRSRLDVMLVERGLFPHALARTGRRDGRARPGGRPPGRQARHPRARGRRGGRARGARSTSRAAASSSRGALDALAVDVSGASALDLGASTGGFTDCLLRRGAERVIALDVGYGQLDWRLRQDPRVHVMERTNARHLAPGGPAVRRPTWSPVTCPSSRSARSGARWPPVWRPAWRAMVMVKPQFEVGRERVGRAASCATRPPGRTRCAACRGHRGGGREGARARPTPGCPGPKGNREVFVSRPSADVASDERRPAMGSGVPISIEGPAARCRRVLLLTHREPGGDRLGPPDRALDPPGGRRGGAGAGRRGRQAPHPRAVLLGGRHGACGRRRGPDPGARRRRQHPAGAGPRGRLRRAGDRRQLRAGRLPGLDRAREPRARPARARWRATSTCSGCPR